MGLADNGHVIPTPVTSYNYFAELKRKQAQATAGVNLTPKVESDMSKLCIANFDDSVTVGGFGGLPINENGLSILNFPSMGAVATTSPILTPSSPTITYPVSGNGTYDAAATFSVNLDFATAIDVNGNHWLVGLVLCAVNAGDVTNDPRDFPYPGPVPINEWTGFSVKCVWTGIGAGRALDLYVAYIDGQGRMSLPTKVGTTNPNQAGTTSLLGVPTTPPNPSSAAGAFSYASNGGGTYDALCTIHLDVNGTTANNALGEIECVMAPHASAIPFNDTTGAWSPVGNPQLINGTGSYGVAWAGCGVQVQFDVGVRYVGQNGSRSFVYIIGTTTAAQFAQLPFFGAVIDPTTGYLVISDQAVYPTTQPYTFGAAGPGSMLAASWNVKTGSTAVSPTVWIFYTSASGGNGYIAYWNEINNKVEIYKCVSGGFTLLAQSTIAIAHDTTKFHNIELVASELIAGTVLLTATLDGILMCTAADASSPFTSGAVAAQFRDTTATNFIDEKTVEITFGGNPSSAGFKGQGSSLPISVPAASFNFVLVGTFPFASSFMDVNIPAGTVQYPDGTTVATSTFTSSPVIGGEGLYFIMCSYDVFNNTFKTAIQPTTPFTAAQKAVFVGDGLVPMAINFSVDTTGFSTGGSFPINNNFGGRAL